MMANDLLSKIKEIKGINQNSKLEQSIYLFFSFDLVNSTAFKTDKENKKKWLKLIIQFYELIYAHLKKELPEISIWKYLGDEILLYFRIDDIKKIYNSPCFTYKIQTSVLNDLDDLFQIKDKLNIKSTLWIAGITIIPPIDPKEYDKYIDDENSVYRNIGINLPNSRDGRDDKDFLGIDIDTGFRISNYANKDKVTLSAELAYLLHRMDKGDNKDIDNNMRIVSHEILKGVWNNKAYPIIWYYHDWQKIFDSFDYDEYKKNEIVQAIYMQKETMKSTKTNIDELEKVFEQLKQLQYRNKFNADCAKLKTEKNKNIRVINGV
jgi:hypothetical protein